MATELQISRFRSNVGDNNPNKPVFTDAEIDDLFLQAAEIYTSGGNPLLLACATRLAYHQILANSVKLVTYRQNTAGESLSDVTKNVRIALEEARRLENEMLTSERRSSSQVRFGGMKPRPTRPKEYPDA